MKVNSICKQPQINNKNFKGLLKGELPKELEPYTDELQKYAKVSLKDFPIDIFASRGRINMKNWGDTVKFSFNQFGNLFGVELPISEIRTLENLKLLLEQTKEYSASVRDNFL